MDEHWQGRTIAVMLRHTQAGDIGAPSAENADFVVIQTHLSFGFLIGRTITRFTSIRLPVVAAVP